MKTKASVAAIVAALAACLHTHASAETAPLPDAGVYSQYEVSVSRTYLYWRTCGTVGDTTRCFGFGDYHGFGKIGALLLGEPAVADNVVTRALYVLDTAKGATNPRFNLGVYSRTDRITSDRDIPKINLVTVLPLPLAGGTSVISSMAANDRYLFIGSSASEKVVKVDKQTLSVTQADLSFPRSTVCSITADEAGYVTVNWNTPAEFPANFGIFGPDGELLETGPGPEYQLGTRQALLLDAVP